MAAPFVMTDAFVELNGVDLSAWVSSVTLNPEREAQEDTSMGNATRTNLPGLKTWGVEIELKQDYSASAVDQTIWPLFDNGTTFTWKLRAKKASAKSTTNPEWSATGFITSYNPVGGSVGEKAAATISIVPGGSAPDLARATA